MAADLVGHRVPGEDPVQAAAHAGVGGLHILQPLQIEHLVLEHQIAHRRVVDGCGHRDELGEHAFGRRRDLPDEPVLRCCGQRFGVATVHLRPVDLGQHLTPPGIVAGVDKSETFEESTSTEVVLGGADPDDRATELAGLAEDLLDDRRPVAAAAIIRMDD